MRKSQSSTLNALLQVQTLFQANPTLIATPVALEEASEELSELIVALNENVKLQAASTGATQSKQDAQIAVGNLAFEIAGAIFSFAQKSGDTTLAGRVSFSRSAITQGSSNAVSARIQGIIDTATETIASLGDHGITQAKVNTLKQRLKSYDALRVLPRQTTAAATAATRQLERLFPKATQLLEDRIDRLMWQFRESEPEFYDKYQVARSIVSAPTSSSEPAVTKVVPVPTATSDTKAA